MTRFKLKNHTLKCICKNEIYTLNATELICNQCYRRYVLTETYGTYRSSGYRCPECKVPVSTLYPIKHNKLSYNYSTHHLPNKLCAICVTAQLNLLIPTHLHLGKLIHELEDINLVESI